MFSSLKIRNFRLLLGAQIISNIGIWMQRIAQDWLVLTLTDHSPVALGIASALQFAPFLLFSLWAGAVADRVDKRRLVLVTQTLICLQSLVLGLLVVTGSVQLWQVFLFCLIFGFLDVFESPARSALLVEIVGKEKVASATALNSSTSTMAALVGPAIAGYAIAGFGIGWLFLIDAMSTSAVVVGLMLMNPSKLFRAAIASENKKQIRAGLFYISKNLNLIAVMILILVVGSLAIHFAISLGIAAVKVFHVGAAEYGLMASFLAVGSFVGVFVAARLGARKAPEMTRLLLSIFIFGLGELVVAFMPTYLAFCIVLVPVSCIGTVLLTTALSFVQIVTLPEMLGRVMAFYFLMLVGGNTLTSPILGWLASVFGGRSLFIVGGVASICAAGICAITLSRKRKVEIAVGT